MSLAGITAFYFVINLMVAASFSVACWLLAKQYTGCRRVCVIGGYVAMMSLYVTYAPIGFVLLLHNWR